MFSKGGKKFLVMRVNFPTIYTLLSHSAKKIKRIYIYIYIYTYTLLFSLPSNVTYFFFFFFFFLFRLPHMFSLVYVLLVLSIHGYCSIFLYLNFDTFFDHFAFILIHSFFYCMHSSI